MSAEPIPSLTDGPDETAPLATRTMHLLQSAADASSPAVRAQIEERVIELNMPIAAQVAARYRSRGVPTEDLEQVAYMALVKAMRRYEYSPDRPFLSFAVPTIRGEVQRYFRDQAWAIRPTRPIQDAQARIRGAEGDLAQSLGRAPRPSELAEHLDLDVELVVEALAANGCFQPHSLDTPKDDGAPTWGPSVLDRGFDEVEARAMLRPLLAGLSQREKVMIQMRFFQNATQAQIGEVLGVTQMQVSRLLSDLMTRLRSQLDSAAPALDEHTAGSAA